MAYYVADEAVVRGKVAIGEEAGIWYHATIRADSDQIMIGSRTNVQDNAVIHTSRNYPVSIGNGVTIGHSAIVHGCTVGNNTLVGMGAIILNGALVTQNSNIPDGSLAFGNPAKIIRKLTEEEIADNKGNADRYVQAARAQLPQK